MHVLPALVVLLLAPAVFAADAARGEVVFNAQCSLCHEARAPEQGTSGKARTELPSAALGGAEPGGGDGPQVVGPGP